jgi:hypothetical protein
MNASAKLDAPLRRQVGIAFKNAVLNLDGAAHALTTLRNAGALVEE